MLNADELAGMRSTADDALPDTCTISRPSYVSDSAGGQTATYVQVGGTIVCRVSPDVVGGSAEREQADHDTSTTDWVITVPYNTDVTSKDRVLFGARRFEVTEVRAAMSWEISRRLTAVEVI